MANKIEEKIRERIETLEGQRDKYIEEANQQIGMFNIALRELYNAIGEQLPEVKAQAQKDEAS